METLRKFGEQAEAAARRVKQRLREIEFEYELDDDDPWKSSNGGE